MNSSVSIEDKKLFLEWLLSQFDPGEIEWLLEEILEDERKLEIIHFVDQVEGCPKGITLKVGEASVMQFLFFKGHIKTRDVYTAYHELQLYGDEAYFIQVDFPDKRTNLLYQTVMEADEAEKTEMKFAAEQLLDKLLYDRRTAYLEERINLALDTTDETAFHRYSIQLKEHRKKK